MSKKRQKADDEFAQRLEAHIIKGRDMGLAADQQQRFIKAGIILQPRGMEFCAACRECDAPDGPTAVGYAGGRGSGKSFAVFAQMAVDDCQRVAGLKCLYLRKIGKTNREQFDDIRRKVLSKVPHTYAEQKGLLTIDSTGSQIRVGHFKDEKDIDAYLGVEYDLMVLEETTQLSFSKWKNILSCLRTSKTNWRPRVYCPTNPGGLGHCIPYGEVLTPNRGWVDIKDFKVGDAVYSVNQSGQLIESVVDQVHSQVYSGDLIEINQRGFHLSCTPNHKIAVVADQCKNRRLEAKKFVLKQADNLPGSAKIKRSVEWVGQEIGLFEVPLVEIRFKERQPTTISGNDYCALMGWFLSEGHAMTKYGNKHFGIAQQKKHNLPIIKALLDYCGFKSSYDGKSFCVYSPSWAAYFKQFGYCHQKFIPQSIKSATKNQLSIFFDSLMAGDGHWSSKTGGSYYTTSQKLADDVQEIAIKLGYVVRASKRIRKDRNHPEIRIDVKINKDGCAEILTGNHIYKVATEVKRGKNLQKIPFVGPVFCIGVRNNHTFVVRQNGSIWVSGNSWYKQVFVLPARTKSQRDTRYVHTTVHDNAHVNKEYLGYLESLVGWQREAWLNGSWDIAAGQFFINFREKVHVLDNVDISKAVKWIGAFDYGWSHWTCIYIGFVDDCDRIFVVDRVRARMKTPQEISSQYFSMLARNRLHPFHISHIAAGPDVFSRESDGTTIADQYHRLGINLTCGKIDRVNGWSECLRRFGDPDNGVKPTVFIHRRCSELIEQIPTLQHDPKRPEDVEKVDCDPEDGSGGDDDSDCLRLMLATNPSMGVINWLRPVSIGGYQMLGA